MIQLSESTVSFGVRGGRSSERLLFRGRSWRVDQIYHNENTSDRGTVCHTRKEHMERGAVTLGPVEVFFFLRVRRGEITSAGARLGTTQPEPLSHESKRHPGESANEIDR